MGFFKSLIKGVGSVAKKVVSPVKSIINPIAGLAGNLIDKKSIEESNRKNRASSLNQMEFQSRMSNTAHQREVEDLMRAGLNPILSAKFGGASTPTGSVSTYMPEFQGSAEKIRQGSDSYMNRRFLTASTSKLNAESISSLAKALVDMQSAGMDTSKLGKFLMQADKIMKPMANAAGIALGAAGGSIASRFFKGRKIKKIIDKSRKRDKKKADFGGWEFKPSNN